MTEFSDKPTGKVALLGLLTAAALLLGWVESLLPIFAAVPGVKLGLANAAVLFAMYILGNKEAFAVSMAKVLLSALLFGGMSTLMYSAAGALLSFSAMLLAKRCKAVGCVGVSAAGGAAHIAAQLVVAIFLSATPQIWRLSGALLLSGTLSGAVIGIICAVALKRLEKINLKKGNI